MSSTTTKAYWNSRGYKKAPLSRDAKLYDRIKHGDFDVSYYQKLIEEEKANFAKEEAQLRKTLGHINERDETVSHYRRKHFRKIIQLKEKLMIDEEQKLNELRSALRQEFGHDWWDELSEHCDGGPMQLYEMYKQKSKG